jgi:spore maturation protein CgeB
MRLLIAGSEEIWSLEKYYAKYLGMAGIQVRTIPVQSIFYEYYNKSIVNKILYKAGLSSIGRVIEKKFKADIEQWRPHVLWVFKGMELTPEMLKWAKGKGVRLVNYNPDNPFLFSGKGSGNKNVADSIGVYDLHFTYDQSVRSRIEQEYKIPCSILPFGFEVSEELYAESCRQKEVVRLCFLGNPDEQRAFFIRQLADDFPIDVYGHDWGKFIDHKNVTVYPPVYGDEFWKTLNRYRVQLNLMRQHNPDSHNMRSFEIPGVGAIGLFPRTTDHSLFFEEQREIYLYQDILECKKYAAIILQMTEEEAGRMRLAAREKSLRAGYTYRDRALQALREMEKLIATPMDGDFFER